MNRIPGRRFRVPLAHHARKPKGEMNKGEKDYAGHLEILKRAEEIIDYGFESITLLLTENVPGKRNAMRLTPDFFVVTKEGFELHEVKNYWAKAKSVHYEGDALSKLKTAADKYPWFRWIVVYKKDGRWEQYEF